MFFISFFALRMQLWNIQMVLCAAGGAPRDVNERPDRRRRGSDLNDTDQISTDHRRCVFVEYNDSSSDGGTVLTIPVTTCVHFPPSVQLHADSEGVLYEYKRRTQDEGKHPSTEGGDNTEGGKKDTDDNRDTDDTGDTEDILVAEDIVVAEDPAPKFNQNPPRAYKPEDDSDEEQPDPEGMLGLKKGTVVKLGLGQKFLVRKVKSNKKISVLLPPGTLVKQRGHTQWLKLTHY